MPTSQTGPRNVLGRWRRSFQSVVSITGTQTSFVAVPMKITQKQLGHVCLATTGPSADHIAPADVIQAIGQPWGSEDCASATSAKPSVSCGLSPAESRECKCFRSAAC
jgi:hypothetical protein